MLAAFLIPVLLAASPQHSLDAAKARWKHLGARDYTYVVTPTCGRCMAEPARIRVRAGRPQGAPKAYAKLDTVPELFAYVQNAIDSHPYRLDVSYGPRSGVPTMVSVDPDRSVADDVSGFVVQGFRRT